MAVESLDKRFADLFDRLNVLQEATTQLKELIDRLANSNFQPGSVPLGASDDDSDNVVSELSSEINQILREQEEELELLQEEITDIHSGRPDSPLHHEKARLKDGAERLDSELRDCRKSFRKAQIAARQNLREAQRREREILYASFAIPRSGASSPALGAATPTTTAAPNTLLLHRRRKIPTSEMSKEEQMISTSHDVTQSMRRTHDMMAAELAKSDFAHNTLRESTEALAQLSENYSSLDSMLTNSRALLGTLLKSQKSDTWYLQSAFYLLVVTVGWLFFRRLLWGPTWWLVWLPLKLVFRTAVGVSNAVGKTTPAQSDSESAAAAVTGASQQAVYMNNEDVPTLRVATDDDAPPLRLTSQQAAAAAAADQQQHQQEKLVMEHIAKVIDEEEGKNGPLPVADEEGEVETNDNNDNSNSNSNSNSQDNENKGETVLREREPWELPNPKKRMMEGPPGNQYRNQQQRARDEL